MLESSSLMLLGSKLKRKFVKLLSDNNTNASSESLSFKNFDSKNLKPCSVFWEEENKLKLENACLRVEKTTLNKDYGNIFMI